MNFSVSAKEMERTGTKNPEGTEAVQQEAKRPGMLSKKMLVISSVVCGGIALLLWAMLGFPRKFKNARNLEEKTCAPSATTCPQGWYQIRNKCFFASEQEITWRDSQANCMGHHGSLLIFISQNEVDFLSYHLEDDSYWIGLKRHNVSERWMWANGDALSNRFTIKGNGKCGFIFKKGLSSANCDDTKKYICSRKGICP